VKLAYTLDFGCVTTVYLSPANSRQVKPRAKLNMRVWRNWQTHEILAALRQCIYSLQALAGKNQSKTKYAPVVKLAYTLDFGCVTTVHLFRASSQHVKIKSKIKYAGVAELADARDLGCVTTVHLFPASSRQVKTGQNWICACGEIGIHVGFWVRYYSAFIPCKLSAGKNQEQNWICGCGGTGRRTRFWLRHYSAFIPCKLWAG